VGTDTNALRSVPVSDVLIENATSSLQKSLQAKMPSQAAADRIFARAKSELPETLKLNVDATLAEQKAKEDAVKPQMDVFPVGTVLAQAKDAKGVPQPIDDISLEKLKTEYQTELSQQSFSSKFAHSLAVLGSYVALFVLCGFYIYHREPRVIEDLGRLATLLALVVVTVSLIVLTSNDWHAETVPLMLFGMTVAIAYEQEIALLLSAAVTLISVVALGHSLADAIVLLAATAGAILLLGRVRSRSKLLWVGFWSAGVAAFTALGVGTLEGHPLTTTLHAAAYFMLWAVIAGSLMTCMLEMVEKVFGVQTDLSLIALGDPARPLLQEFDHRGFSGRGGSGSDRRTRIVGSRRRLLPRHRQDAQAGLFRRESGARRQPSSVARTRDEHARDHCPREGRRRLGAAVENPRADHRLHSAAPRHDTRRVFLPPSE
jgi:membrane-associated HD superfamily phosphohydrolase